MLYLFYPFLKFLSHDICVGSFQHHGNSTDTFTFAIFCHSTETLGRTESDNSYIADVYRNSISVGNHNLFDILDPGNHTFRPDIVGILHFLNVASTCVLIVTAKCFEHFTNSNIQREQGIRVYGYFILFQITAETIDFYNTGYTGQLALHHPVLNGTEFHCIIFLLISGSHFQYVLVNFSQSGSDRHHLRCSEFCGNFTCYGLYLFIYQLSCIECGYTFFENDRNY